MQKDALVRDLRKEISRVDPSIPLDKWNDDGVLSFVAHISCPPTAQRLFPPGVIYKVIRDSHNVADFAQYCIERRAWLTNTTPGD